MLVDTDKTVKDLNAKFAAPVSEFYKRHIFFWYDEKREFGMRVANRPRKGRNFR